VNRARSRVAAVLCLLAGACATRRAEEPAASFHMRPAGVVRRVNRPEMYVIFESPFVFRNGQEVEVLRMGRRVGRLRVHRLQTRPFYAADILDGAPQAGDLVE